MRRLPHAHVVERRLHVVEDDLHALAQRVLDRHGHVGIALKNRDRVGRQQRDIVDLSHGQRVRRSQVVGEEEALDPVEMGDLLAGEAGAFLVARLVILEARVDRLNAGLPRVEVGHVGP